MKAKHILTILGSFFLFSCATKSVVPSHIPKAPQQTESVIPAIVKTEENIQKIVNSNEQLKEKTKIQEDTILTQKVKITEALAQAQRIQEKAKAKELITELEAMEMTTKIKSIEDENFTLTKQISKLKENLDWQSEFLEITKNDAADARYKLLQSEKELTTLRENYQFTQEVISTQNDSIAKLQGEITKLNKEVGRSNVYRNWIIGIVATFVGWIVIKNILMIYFPTTKFRI